MRFVAVVGWHVVGTAHGVGVVLCVCTDDIRARQGLRVERAQHATQSTVSSLPGSERRELGGNGRQVRLNGHAQFHISGELIRPACGIIPVISSKIYTVVRKKTSPFHYCDNFLSGVNQFS